jgi:hypothetical protein
MSTLAFRIDIELDDDALTRVGDPDSVRLFIAETVADGLGPASTAEIPVRVEQLDTRVHDDDCGTLCSGISCDFLHACSVCSDDEGDPS